MNTKKIKLKLAFRKVTKDSSFIGNLICKWTESKYYHIEMIIDDLWISSNAPHGVSINNLKEIDFNKWDIYTFNDIEILEVDYNKIMTYIYNQKELKYDYTGILFSQFFPFTLHSRKRLFCSEFVIKILQLFLMEEVLDLQPNNVSPGDIAKIYKLERN